MRVFIEGDPIAGTSYPTESYAYDSSGYRVTRIDKTGKPVLSLRDEKGSPLSDFIVDQFNTLPRLDKDFVYTNGQLLIERTVSPAEPTMKTNSTLKTGTAYNLQLTSQTGFASYAVDISANSGWRRQVSGLHPNAQNAVAQCSSRWQIVWEGVTAREQRGLLELLQKVQKDSNTTSITIAESNPKVAVGSYDTQPIDIENLINGTTREDAIMEPVPANGRIDDSLVIPYKRRGTTDSRIAAIEFTNANVSKVGKP